MNASNAILPAPTPALPRSRGRAEIIRRDGRLGRLFQQGCSKILLPRSTGPMTEAVIVNTAGGVTGGDVIALSAEAGPNEALSLATQAAERIYRSSGGAARISTRLRLGAGARLDWLPQETILFDGAALERRLEIDMAADARLLALESLTFGRAAMGETIRRLHLRDDWRMRRDGRLVHAEALRLDAIPQTRATMAGVRASATLLYAAPDAEARRDAARAVLSAACPAAVEAGISAWRGLLVARLLAPSAQALRAALVPLILHLRGAPLPRVWQF